MIFTAQAHIADTVDVLDDTTIPYKSESSVLTGKVEINRMSDDNSANQQQFAFSRTPDKGRIKGIASSNDSFLV
jgi:hypothetical protein